MKTIDVSIIIVCMNNYQQLKDCLDSIKNYTHRVNYETLIVAYFFGKDNLDLLKVDYPWVKIIISDEIRGFSANNNLALRVAKGKYCFVLNDDTYFNTPVVDQLYESIESNEGVTLVSPKIVSPSGLVQYAGIPPITWIDFLLIQFHLKKERVDKNGRYVRSKGFFKTYNILGAAFLIDTKVFRELGFFDEQYFFGPEDKALSTLMNKRGYSCYVNADIVVTHLGGQTGGPQTRTLCATRPAGWLGCIIFYSEGKALRRFVLSSLIWLKCIIWAFGWAVKYLLGNKNAYYSYQANLNVCKIAFSKKDTTEIFKRFYIQKTK